MSPTFWKIERKNKRFVTKTSPGPHNSKFSIPLTVLIRDILKLTKTYSETKIVIREGGIKIDGRIKKDPSNSIYRLVPSKQFLTPIIISEKEKTSKLCKIMNKKTLDKDNFQYSLHDGRTIKLNSSTNIPVGSTLKIELPSQKVEKIIEMKPNNLVVLTGGQNKGLIGMIKDIKPSSYSRTKMLDIDVNNNLIEVKANLVMVVGEKKTELNIKGE